MAITAGAPPRWSHGALRAAADGFPAAPGAGEVQLGPARVAHHAEDARWNKWLVVVNSGESSINIYSADKFAVQRAQRRRCRFGLLSASINIYNPSIVS